MDKCGVNLKGAAFKAIVEYVRNHYGDEGLQRVLDQVAPEIRDSLGLGVLITNWYPIEYVEEFIGKADKIHGRGDLQMAAEMGRFSANFGMNVIYRTVIRVGSPEFALGKAAMMWSRYYDSGKLTTLSLEKGSIALQLNDFNYKSEIMCTRVTGWMGRFVEMTGAHSPKVVHEKCVNRGDAFCEWRARWT